MGRQSGAIALTPKGGHTINEIGRSTLGMIGVGRSVGSPQSLSPNSAIRSKSVVRPLDATIPV